MNGKKLAIITARGGSKRIPRKNIKDFCGKPILCYSIEAAFASGAFDEVMVSTDDAEIAEIARSTGASVPFFRSAEMSGDYASTDDVIMEVLKEFNYKELPAHNTIAHEIQHTSEQNRARKQGEQWPMPTHRSIWRKQHSSPLFSKDLQTAATSPIPSRPCSIRMSL